MPSILARREIQAAFYRARAIIAGQSFLAEHSEIGKTLIGFIDLKASGA